MISAAKIVLDRAGFHPSVSLELNAASSEQAPWAAFVTPEEMATVSVIIERARLRMASGEPTPTPRLLPPSIDGEVLNGDDEEVEV